MTTSDPRPILPLWAALIAAVAGGLAYDASFPALGIWPLAFVAVALSLVSLVGRRAGAAFLVALAFGASFYFPAIDWIDGFLGDDPLSWVPWVALAGVEALFMGAGGVLIALAYRWVPRVIRRPGWRLAATAALVAGIWTAREIVMISWPYTGFPWGRLGMSQASGPLAQVASWVGTEGLTFLCALAVALLVETGRAVRWAGVPRRVPAAGLGAAAVLAIALVVVPQFPTTEAGSIRVGAAQGDGPAAYADQRARYDVLDAQLQASDPVIGQDVDLVLWPEGGLGGVDPLTDRAAAAALTRAAATYGAPILMNSAVAQGQLVYNMSMLWTADEGPVAHHSKRYPVPFGEYVPDRAFYEAIVPSLIGLIGREYEPGDDAPLMHVGDVAVGLAICFDVAFDDLVWEGAQDGAQIYMFQTNNADFRGSDENLQQLEMARMRAIETGRSVVNVSTVGTSQVIAPDGTTVDEIPADEQGLIVADVELRDGLTPAVVAGEGIRLGLLVVPAAALLALGILAIRARRRA